MEQPRYQRWLRQVYETQDEEIPCSELFEQIAQYVDREIAGEPVAETMPQVKHTLEVCRDQCRACYELYVVLRNLALLEKVDDLPPIDEPHRQ
ncbi:MAG TPA: hypothetical protein VLG46_15990 [Anaerolineae bacterium]|nr:hypothetical protein [Anaerolineae bacterium]